MNAKITKLLKQNKNILKQKYHLKKIGIFGSYARGEENQNSDIDIFIDVNKSDKTYEDYIGLKSYLENLLDIKVDLVFLDSMNPIIKYTAVGEMITIE